MWRSSWALFTIFVLFSAPIGQHCEAKAAEPNPIVVVQVDNRSPLAVPSLIRAQELATAIYGRAGVTLQWTLDGTSQPDRLFTMILTTSATAPPDLDPDSMGVSPSPGDGSRGTTAYIFMDRVKAFTKSKGVASHYVLACALAHEIGHLLLPVNAHRPDGIMRGTWYAADFPPRAPGIPAFPPDQAKLIRLRARRQ